MKKTTFQHPELRDANDNIIQEGTYGKTFPLVNGDNTGVLDYINNNLEALYDAQTAAGNAITTGTLTVSGKTTTGTLDAGDTTVTGTVKTSGLTVTGQTTVPTANAGNSSKAIANTEFVQGELTNYLPLSGGTITGVLTNNGSTSIPINIKTTGTNYRDIQIESSDGKHRIAAIRASKTSEGRCEITIGASTTSNAAPEGITISRSTTNIYATAPTPDATDNSKKIATTAFVNAKAGNYLPLSGGTVTGGLTVKGTITGNLAGNADTATSANTIKNFEKATASAFRNVWFSDSNNNAKPVFYEGIQYNPSTNVLKTGTFQGKLNGNADTATKATNDANGNPIASTYLPAVVGVVQAFAGSTIPTGWLLCDGSAVSRTTYAKLYACIGTTYGKGNGSTTFNLPNLTDKFIQGSATAGTVKSAGLPNITGQLQLRNGDNVGFELNNINGAFSAADSTRVTSYVESHDYAERLFAPRLKFSAHDSSSIYGNSDTVQPPALTMRYIIKY